MTTFSGASKIYSQRYRPDIDGLRALAVLPVVLFHGDLICTGGFVGVDIFFVISGFLITSLILKAIGDDVFCLVTFWERRIRRILPALFVVVLATLATGWFVYLPEDFMSIGKSTLAQAILASNFFFLSDTGYFEDAADTKPLLHTWSLAVEEQFYVLFPLLLIFLARHKRFGITRSILCFGVGSFALCVVGSYCSPSATFYLLPTRAWEFMAGAFLAAIPGWRLSNRWLNEAAGLSGLALILYSIFFYTHQTRFPGLAAIPPCLGAALIIFSGDAKSTLVGRVLGLKPVVFVGLISYSLYLWHWPLLVFSRYICIGKQSLSLRVVLLIASVALAILSWKFIETPFRKRLFFPRRPQVFAFAGCSMLIMLIFGGCVYFESGMPSRFSAQALRYDDCRNEKAFRNEISLRQAVAGQFDELGAQSTHQPIEILIWGDSHAMAVTPVLDELCRRYSVRGVQATHSATPPLLEFSSSNPYSLMGQTPAFSKAVVEFVSQRHVKIVILAACWTSYGPSNLLSAELTSTVQAIMASGARVYILKDVPIPGFDVPRHAALTVSHQGDLAKLAIPQSKVQIANKYIEPIFDHLSEMGVTVLDTPRYFQNTNGFYDVVREGKTLYWDWHHLSIEGSKLLAPLLEPLFSQN
jgi:peptidoglycan/LPS O-acetylase OafA/YrhL